MSFQSPANRPSLLRSGRRRRLLTWCPRRELVPKSWSWKMDQLIGLKGSSSWTTSKRIFELARNLKFLRLCDAKDPKTILATNPIHPGCLKQIHPGTAICFRGTEECPVGSVAGGRHHLSAPGQCAAGALGTPGRQKLGVNIWRGVETKPGHRRFWSFRFTQFHFGVARFLTSHIERKAWG